MKEIDVLVVIPVPASHYQMLLDVIESVECYLRRKYHILVVDDSGSGVIRERVEHLQKEHVSVICNPFPLGKKGGLFISFARAYTYALENFAFKIALRLDTDALVTGYGLDDEAIDFFEAHPSIGMIGSYTVKSDGSQRRWWQWALVLLYESSPLRALGGKQRLWHRELKRARKNGYRLGENVFGGACILSHRCLAAMSSEGTLALEPITLLEEDVIFSLLAKAAGFGLGDLGKPEQSMSLGMYNLPISKEEVVSQGKKLIHSVKRGLHGESQEELRTFFRGLRSASAGTSAGDASAPWRKEVREGDSGETSSHAGQFQYL